jgi:hypothetical protein
MVMVMIMVVLMLMLMLMLMGRVGVSMFHSLVDPSIARMT